MTDQPTQKSPDSEMTQLEAMDYIIKNLDTAVSYIATARIKYKMYLSKRRFAKKELDLLTKSYDKALTVWYNMKKRMEREEKNVRSKK